MLRRFKFSPSSNDQVRARGILVSCTLIFEKGTEIVVYFFGHGGNLPPSLHIISVLCFQGVFIVVCIVCVCVCVCFAFLVAFALAANVSSYCLFGC